MSSLSGISWVKDISVWGLCAKKKKKRAVSRGCDASIVNCNDLRKNFGGSRILFIECGAYQNILENAIGLPYPSIALGAVRRLVGEIYLVLVLELQGIPSNETCCIYADNLFRRAKYMDNIEKLISCICQICFWNDTGLQPSCCVLYCV